MHKFVGKMNEKSMYVFHERYEDILYMDEAWIKSLKLVEAFPISHKRLLSTGVVQARTAV